MLCRGTMQCTAAKDCLSLKTIGGTPQQFPDSFSSIIALLIWFNLKLKVDPLILRGGYKKTRLKIGLKWCASCAISRSLRFNRVSRWKGFKSHGCYMGSKNMHWDLKNSFGIWKKCFGISKNALGSQKMYWDLKKYFEISKMYWYLKNTLRSQKMLWDLKKM